MSHAAIVEAECVIRIWCSPRVDMGGYPWNWAVHRKNETLEFGCEKTEAEARREAEGARDHWAALLSPNDPRDPRGKQA